MFPALRPSFKTILKIMKKNVCQNFVHRWFNVLRVQKRFPFGKLLVLETARSQLEPIQESMVDDPWRRCFFLLKTATLEAKNFPAHVAVKNQMSDLFITLLACASLHQ
jgi:hypothetical protein